jgi:hypothetical protein
MIHIGRLFFDITGEMRLGCQKDMRPGSWDAGKPEGGTRASRKTEGRYFDPN